MVRTTVASFAMHLLNKHSVSRYKRPVDLTTAFRRFAVRIRGGGGGGALSASFHIGSSLAFFLSGRLRTDMPSPKPKSCRVGNRTIWIDIPNVGRTWHGLEGPSWIDETWPASAINLTIRFRLQRDACRIQHMPVRQLTELQRQSVDGAKLFTDGSAYRSMYAFYFYHTTNELNRRRRRQRNK
jgi:hypothetical protein